MKVKLDDYEVRVLMVQLAQAGGQLAAAGAGGRHHHQGAASFRYSHSCQSPRG